MDSKFTPSALEEKLYRFWEERGYFTARVTSEKKPFSIILPPPNANADLHLGHAMYVYEDIMIRYHRLLGDETLWLPGADHAGIETQFVFEKQLQKEGKSRFDFDRETLFQMIWDFVAENRPRMENQLRRLGFALDWTKSKFTMDEDIVRIVYKTFKKLSDGGLIYRDKRLVNYCTHCGTGFSDLEVKHIEQTDPLYYMKYGPFVLATVRPETKFGDTALAVHPSDKRYGQWVGKEVEAEGLLGKFTIKVIADDAVDPKFGTGVVKVTPGHDFNDFEMGRRHNLEIRQVIGFDGKLTKLAGPYAGLRVKAARAQVAAELEKRGFIDHVDKNYTHSIGVCYRCGTTLEPLPLDQWYIKVKPLTQQAARLVEEGKIILHPRRFKKHLIRILENFVDWNISRQIVWGIRIPAWRCRDCEKKGSIRWIVTDGEKPANCDHCRSVKLEQDTDTFDTWFSSSQWPFATLLTLNPELRNTNHELSYFDYFYPTSVMETGYDILRAWVARMIMIGYFSTKQVPFQTVFLHGMVRDKKGQKMSKSKGNVINPLEMVDKYGADALRAALIFGTAEGNDTALSEEKIIGMRNFANKIWNIGRFIYMNQGERVKGKGGSGETNILSKLKKEFEKEKKEYMKYMKANKFSLALGLVYEFLWHRYADYYIEQLKEELKDGNMEVLQLLETVYCENLKMLHPFMPFVTDAVWKALKGEESSILDERY